MQEIIDQVGAAEAEEALVCALVMSTAFNAAAIRNRLDAHLALDDAFEDAGIEEGEDRDWDELQDDGKPNYFADNTGGKFD